MPPVTDEGGLPASCAWSDRAGTGSIGRHEEGTQAHLNPQPQEPLPAEGPSQSLSLLATYHRPLISSLLQMRSFGKSKAITLTGLQRKLIRSQVTGCFRPYTGPHAVLRTEGVVRLLTEGGQRDPGQTDLPGAKRTFYPPKGVNSVNLESDP